MPTFLIACLLLAAHAAVATAVPATAPTIGPGLPGSLESRLDEGIRLVRTGDALAAEPVLREAELLAAAVADTARHCAALRWLSVAVGAQGRRAEAHALYLRLGELARASGDLAHEGWSLVGLAWEAGEEGRAGEAAAAYRRASERFAAAGAADGEIWALNGLGLALSRAGDRAGAVDCYRRTAARAAAAGFAMAEALALNNLGHHEYLVGDPGEALRHFARALELQRSIGQRREAVTPAVNLALAHTELGHLDLAESLLDSTLAACRELGHADLQGMVLNELARVSLARGLPGAAAIRWREALTLGTSLTAELRARCLVGLASATGAAGDPRPALEILEAGIRQLRGLALGTYEGTLDLELGRRRLEAGLAASALAPLASAAAQARAQGPGGLEVEALVLTARAESALGRPDSSLAHLRRAAAAWERERDLPLDPEWREQRAAAGRAVFTDLAALLLDGGAAAPAAFEALQPYKARGLRERMLGPAPAAGAAAGPPATSLPRLQSQVLRPGELLLDAYLGPRFSVLFAVTIDTCLAVPWPPAAELEPRLRRYHEVIAAAAGEAGGEADDWRASAAALSDLLLGEVANELRGARRVLVAPDGALALLPLVELPLPGAAGSRDDAPPEWVRVPSAAILADLRLGAAGGGAAAGERPRTLAAAGAEGTRDLPGARREVRRLASRYRDVTTWPAGQPAEPPPLAGYELIHLAAHAEGDDQRPWRSRIELLPAGAPGELTAAMVAGLELDARIVVLASCSSAGSRLQDGEGLLGLGSAFLAAGARAVVATLWPVRDEAAARFGERFYEGLAGGLSVAAAVGSAQAAMRADAGTAHPVHWAGFVVLGDGDAAVQLKERPWPGWAPWALLSACGSLAAGWLVTRARRARPPA